MRFSPVVALLLFSLLARGQSGPERIRLNQVGFYPTAPKRAVVVDATRVDATRVESTTGTFRIRSQRSRRVVFSGRLGAPRVNPLSGKTLRTADFSALRTPGTYVLELADGGTSHPFRIAPDVHRGVAQAALKGFYYQRASTPLLPIHAGRWHRPAGHPDTLILVHPSAASAGRPAGTRLSAPGGWYDAGDYNKYIVNSGITMGTVLALLEEFPAYAQRFEVGIPESGNALPDVLDELCWNLRWMRTMQDPADGGVYHKLTNARFDGMVMPHAATAPRYVVQKSITATLDFAAVLAGASRVLRQYPAAGPGLADSCRRAAEAAWRWAQQHPDQFYRQQALNDAFEPAVVTGGYEDRDARDEWFWAAAELYATTRDAGYLPALKAYAAGPAGVPSWAQVRTMGLATLARLGADAPAELNARPRLLALTDSLLAGAEGQAFQTVMGQTAADYTWGSSAVAANQGVLLMRAYRLTGQRRYRDGALTNLDYLLGRNATGYSFVTGYGTRTVQHPHHRPSVADGIAEPVPGLLSGGPNANAPRQDRCPGYPDTNAADEVFVDADCSYASNEIAINWNAPLVYLSAALEATQIWERRTQR
jgi:endoglucanase